MSQETLSTGAAIGTFVVIAATAIAAVVQLRHLRASNQLQGLLTVLARVEDPNFNAWVDGARRVLQRSISDPAFREQIRTGTFERKENPWLNLANSYEWVASLVKNRLIPEDAFMDIYAFRVEQAWEIIEPVVVIARGRAEQLWENFEYLAVRARMYTQRHPLGTYPKGTPRMVLPEGANSG
jgi:hypothetical protein